MLPHCSALLSFAVLLTITVILWAKNDNDDEDEIDCYNVSRIVLKYTHL